MLVTCPKCNGKKVLHWLMHVDNGICYQCDGTGKVDDVIGQVGPNIEVCDMIFNFIKVCDNGDKLSASVWVWTEGHACAEYAGTGHWRIGGTEASGTFDSSELHRPISEVRQAYRTIVDAGFVIADEAQMDLLWQDGWIM